MGYEDEQFGYKLWDQENIKIIKHKDVIFYKDQAGVDVENAEKSRQDDSVIDLTLVLPQVQQATRDEGEEHGEDDVDGISHVGDSDDELEQNVPQQGEQHHQEEIVESQANRPDREHRLSSRYPTFEYILLIEEGERETFQEVQTHKDNKLWFKAMQEEMSSLQKYDNYELVNLPKDRKALKNKWVLKLIKDGNDNLLKYKARLVVKGFRQKQGIDFDEIFSPVVKLTSIQVVLGLVASMNLEIEQLDVKIAFLNGDLEEEIYMLQSEGFEVKGKQHMVCRLKKILYGLKQAPRHWHKKFDSFMMNHGYQKKVADHCVYIRKFLDDKLIILLLYANDMLIVG